MFFKNNILYFILHIIFLSYTYFHIILKFYMRSLGADLCNSPVKIRIHLAIKSCEYLISNFLGWPVSISCECLGRPCALTSAHHRRNSPMKHLPLLSGRAGNSFPARGRHFRRIRCSGPSGE